jgi:hypothetical protein
VKQDSTAARELHFVTIPRLAALGQGARINFTRDRHQTLSDKWFWEGHGFSSAAQEPIAMGPLRALAV